MLMSMKLMFSKEFFGGSKMVQAVKFTITNVRG